MPSTTTSPLPFGQAGWHADALCAQTDPELFYPEKGGNTRTVKSICTNCDVRTECLEAALDRDELYGIWGGLSRRERELLRRLRNQATGAQRRKAARNLVIAAMAHDQVDIPTVATEIGLSTRAVHRVLRAGRPQNEAIPSTRVA